MSAASRHLRVLRRRAEFLDRRVREAEPGQDLSYDRAERRALEWAIGCLAVQPHTGPQDRKTGRIGR